MPFFVAAIGLLAVAIMATMRNSRQGGGAGSGPPPLERNTGAVSLTTASARKEAAPEEAPKDLLGLAGYLGSKLGEGLAYTNEAKGAALPVGVAVSGAAALATIAAGGSLAVAAVWVIPVVLITANIIAIVDLVARAVQAEKWPRLVQSIAQMRASGDIQGAQALWQKATNEVQNISRIWPRARSGVPGDPSYYPGDDWYNYADPLGRPYPGFPGLPAPATFEELKRWPHLVPEFIESVAGTPGELASGAALPWLPAGRVHLPTLLQAFKQDVIDARAWGLANGVPGRTLLPGNPNAPETNLARYVQFGTATTGDRDIRGWAPLQERLVRLQELARSLGEVIPWLGISGVSQLIYSGVITPYEAALDNAAANAQRAVTSKNKLVVDGKVTTVEPGTAGAVSARQVAAVTRSTGLRGVAAVQVAQEAQADANAAAAETKSGTTTTGATGAGRTGTTDTTGGTDAAERRGTGPVRTGGGTA